MNKKTTRDRIIDASLKLFNEHGAHSITTNHIAEAMGISPGNLYYHFKNKQEIIREIFILITGSFTAIWSDKSPQQLVSVFNDVSDLYYDYRFFYLELPTLIAQDDELKKMYQANMIAKHAMIHIIIDSLISDGILHPADNPRETDAWIENSWIINDFYLSYLFTTGKKITRDNIKEGIMNFFYFIKPALTPKGLSMIQPLL